jgi:hypothetical protein
MQIEYKTKFYIDVTAVDAAIRSVNLPEFSGVSFVAKRLDDGSFDYTLCVNLDHCVNLSEEKKKVIDDIVLSCGPNWDFIRRQRSSPLNEVDWRIQRALDEGEDATQLIEYRRALRDITKQESPDTVVWPTKPW